MERPRWWRFFDPQLTLPLILIVFFLGLIGIGNLFGLYQFAVEGNPVGALLALSSALLYLVPAYGLLKLKRWARLIEMVLSLLLVGLGMILIFTGLSNRELFNLATQGVIITVIHGSVAAYLLTDRCRRAFGYVKVQKLQDPGQAEKEVGRSDKETSKNAKEQTD